MSMQDENVEIPREGVAKTFNKEEGQMTDKESEDIQGDGEEQGDSEKTNAIDGGYKDADGNDINADDEAAGSSDDDGGQSEDDDDSTDDSGDDGENGDDQSDGEETQD